MEVIKFSSYVNEKVNYKALNEELSVDDIKNGMDETYIDFKTDLINMIIDTLETNETIINVDKGEILSFISDITSKGKDSNMIDGLIEDNDIFNFYLKHQSDIDELLNNIGYLEKSPNDNNVFSLYEVILDGTKEAIINILSTIKKELK